MDWKGKGREGKGREGKGWDGKVWKGKGRGCLVVKKVPVFCSI